MQHVALVFDVFDDRDQDARVTLPQEDSLYVRHWIASDKVFNFAIVVGQHDHGYIETRELYFMSKLGGVHLADGKVRDDQVELRIGTRQL